MKVIRQLVVAAALGGGLVSCADAHVSFGVSVGIAAPVFPVVPVYVPPPVYYAPPPPPPPTPVYAAPVVTSYYGPPPAYPPYYAGWHYGYGYWRR